LPAQDSGTVGEVSEHPDRLSFRRVGACGRRA
jgi:hypothetical protein